MAYDIYGNNLRRGYCEVHPHVNQEYPCDICCRDIDQNNRNNNHQYPYGNPEQFDQNLEWVRVVIDMNIVRIPKLDLDKNPVDIDFNGNYLIQIQQEENSKLWKICNAMNGHGNNCFEEFKDFEVSILNN
jgi:hypothetical protein